jgi:hypothetical protein
MQEPWEVNWKDYYRILQVHPTAEQEVIKSAYDRLARKYHPDLNKDPKANQLMKDINEAYEVLRNLERRRRYHPVWLQKRNSARSSTDSDRRAQDAEKQAREAREREQEAVRKAKEAEERAKEAELRAMRAEYQSQQSKQSEQPVYRDAHQTKGESLNRPKGHISKLSRWLFSIAGLLFLFLLVAFIIIIKTSFFHKSEKVTQAPITTSLFSSALPDVKIQSVYLPENARMSFVDIKYTNILTIVNHEPKDVIVGWESSSSIRGKFDFGIAIVPANDVKVINKNYSYSQAGTEDISYKIFYTDSYRKTIELDKWSGSFIILPAPAISLSMDSGSRDSKVTIYGFNFTPGDTIRASDITIDGNPYLNVSQSRIDSKGSFTFNISFLINQPTGTITIKVTDNSGLSASANFVIIEPTQTVNTAEITLSPTSGIPGSKININCRNFTPDETISSSDITFGGITSTGPTFYLDTSGYVSIILTINTNQATGRFLVAVKDSEGKIASAYFTVIPNPSTTIPPINNALASITIFPISGKAGSTLIINGQNFTPNGTVKIADVLWNGLPCTGSNIYTIDSSGTVSISLILSTSTKPGTYSITVNDSSGKKAVGYFTVLN